MIVDEREQVGFPPGRHRPVEDIAGPQQVGGLGLEPAGTTPPRGGAISSRTKCRCRVRSDGAHPPCAACSGLPAPRSGRGSPPSRPPPAPARWPRSAAPRAGRRQQRLEPARPVGPDPPVQALTGHLHRAAGLPGVRLRGDAAHQPAALLAVSPARSPGRSAGSEQRDVLGPRPGRRLLIIDEAHLAPPRCLAGPCGQARPARMAPGLRRRHR